VATDAGRMPRVHRVEPTTPGYSRRRRGNGFSYIDGGGRPIDDSQTLHRIRALAIPPAWTDVWICPDPWGHIQAMGTDAAGRRQYLYHPRWREWRDRLKFRRMHEFARVLPAVRDTVAKHLELPGLPREKALATAIRLLDRAYFRIGSEAYAERNNSYGLATLRKEHVRIDDDGVRFDYTAKGGKRRIVRLRDPQIEPVLRELKARRSGGQELLAYRDERGRWRDVRSADVNEYLKEVTGGRFTAKDFRTWHASVLAAIALAARTDVRPSMTARKRAMSSAIKEVAELVGNTPAVCRHSYIDPRVLDRYFEGATIAGILGSLPAGGDDDLVDAEAQAQIEEAVLALVAGRIESTTPETVAA
jgi:DNA topoisomerase-1